MRPQSLFRYLKDHQNHIELDIKTSFQYNSTILTMFHQNSPQQLNSHHNSIIIKTHGINSSTTHLITATTTINHEFINNIQEQQHHSSSILSKTQSIPIYKFQACKFNINNTIIIKFKYLNIASKHKHEFYQLKSQ